MMALIVQIVTFVLTVVLTTGALEIGSAYWRERRRLRRRQRVDAIIDRHLRDMPWEQRRRAGERDREGGL